MGEDSGGYLKQGVWGHSYRVFYVYDKVIDNARVRNYIKRGQKWVWWMQWGGSGDAFYFKRLIQNCTIFIGNAQVSL